MTPTPPWTCPLCQIPLRWGDAGWHCWQCGQYWEERERIPNFRQDAKAYWGEIPQEQMCGLLREMAREPWREVLHRKLRRWDPGLYRYATDITRADGLLMVPLERESWVLDYGAGWGTLTWALAPWVTGVVALDSTWERLQFLQLKAAQEGWQHVFPLWAGDILPLPLPAGFFDLVILNGVLEWVPLSFPNLHPQDSHQRVLQELYRVLRPGGTLYLAIENRYGFPSLLGATVHGDFPFASVVPRWLSNLISLAVRRRPYRTWIYSYGGYVRLLQQAGFQHLTFYWPYPRYIQPDLTIPLAECAPLHFFLRTAWHSTHWRRRALKQVIKQVHRLGLWKYLVPTYIILAHKEPVQ